MDGVWIHRGWGVATTGRGGAEARRNARGDKPGRSGGHGGIRVARAIRGEKRSFPRGAFWGRRRNLADETGRAAVTKFAGKSGSFFQ